MPVLQGLRDRMARMLSPDTFRRAHQGFYLENRVEEMRWWCNEVPEVEAAAKWLMARTQAYYRDPEEPAPELAEDIAGFRERLRGMVKRRGEVLRNPWPVDLDWALSIQEEKLHEGYSAEDAFLAALAHVLACAEERIQKDHRKAQRQGSIDARKRR